MKTPAIIGASMLVMAALANANEPMSVDKTGTLTITQQRHLDAFSGFIPKIY